MEGRGSCGAQESVEDDPFVVAASMQALDSTNGRKKKLDATINYGYEPEGAKNNACHCFSVFTCRIKFIVTIGRFLIFENKEKKLVFTNFYLFPLPIQKQAEILLKPGSRQEKNGHVVQSKEEPESNSAYPAKGPQRDFNTFATSVELVRTPR